MEHSTTAARIGGLLRYGFLRSGLLLLVLAMAWPQVSHADHTAPDVCPDQTITVAYGGTVEYAACNTGFGIVGIRTPPVHGTATVLDPTRILYAHDAAGSPAATTDSFIHDDGSDHEVTVNVTIVGGTPPLQITPTTIPVAYAGEPYSVQLTASGGDGSYSWTLASGSLPAGVSLSASGLISGTATHMRDDYIFTVQVDDATNTGSQTYSLDVEGATLTLSPNPAPPAFINHPYSVTFTPGGGVAPHTIVVNGGSSLPPGLTLTGHTLSGSPTALATYTFTLLVDDAATAAGTGTNYELIDVTLTVNPQPTITLAPTSLSNPAVGTAYNQSVAASGGSTPYAYAIAAGALPTGLSLDAGTGAITGTPTAGGVFNVTVRGTDADGFSGERAYALTVTAPTISVSPTTLPAATVASAYSQTVSASGGTAPYTYAAAGALPAGLSLSTAGVIAGTPTAGGAFNVDIVATDSSGGTGPYTGTRTYTLAVNAPALALAPATLPDGQQDSAYSQTVSVSGGTAPYAYAIGTGALPAGLSLAAGGVLSGTPTVNGTFNFEVTATDSSTGSGPYSDSRAYSLVIAANPPPVANAVSATVAYGSGSNPVALDISGGTPTAVAIGTAPTNGTAIATGTAITYQPNAGYAGSDSFTYTASNTGGTSAPATVSITVGAPSLTLTPAAGTLATAYGAPYSQAFTASGGAAPHDYALSGALPAGLTFDGASGTVSGTPTQPGSFPVTVTATDSSSGSAAPFSVSHAYTVAVAAPTIVLSAPASVSDGVAGVAYSNSITASGGIGPYTFSVTAGALPAGLVLSADGSMSGTPTESGTFAFDVQAKDANDYTATQSYSLMVAAAALVLTPATLPAGDTSTGYSQNLSTSGGVAPYAYSVTAGALPAGVTLSGGGLLSGTPSASGSFNFTATVTDSTTGTGPGTTARAYTLQVNVLPPVAGAVSAVVAYGSGATPVTLDISGGTPNSVAIGTAAANGTAVASGTSITYQPNAGFAGSDSFTYTASNVGGTSAAATVSITVTAPTVGMTPAAGTLSLPYGAPYSQTFVASGAAAPYSYALSGALPAGVTFDAASGTLSGTPSQPGSFPVTVTATDSSIGGTAPFSGVHAYTLQVDGATIVLDPASLPAGTVGATYGASTAASGGVGPYTFAISTGALPTGLSLAADGTVSGTPTASGTYAFAVEATDANAQTGTQGYSLVVAAATLTLSPSTLADADVGDAYNQAFATSGGIAPYAYAIGTGALPAGLALSAAGVLSGTPTESGTFAFEVRVSDSGGGTPGTTTVAFALDVAAPVITFTPASLSGGVVGAAYGVSIGASGGTGPYTFTVSSGELPAGMTLSADGALSGTPTETGTFAFDLQALDANGHTGTQRYGLAIATAALALTPAALPAGSAGAPYSARFNTSGGIAPYHYAVVAGALPAGLGLSANGVLSGTPTVTGTFAFDVQVSDSSGGTASTATVSYALRIAAPTITLTPAGLLDGIAGVAYAGTFAASGGAAPYAFTVSAGALPTGLSLAADGTLAGTPTTNGTYAFVVEATDANAQTGTQGYSLVVAAATLTLSPSTLADADVGDAYTQAFATSGGIAPYRYAVVAGALPTGLILAADGSLSGMPTVTGTFAFDVQVSDSSGGTASTATVSYALRINAPTITLTPAGLLEGIAGVAYAGTFAASGGTAPYAFTVSAGALPTGLSLAADGTLAGTPTASGTFAFDVQAQDANAQTGAQSYSLTIAAPLIVLTPTRLADGIVGGVYEQAVAASGGVAPYTFAVDAGSLPDGLALSADGALAGTPTAGGTYAFTLSARDANGFTGTGGFSVVIAARSDPSKDPEVLGVLTAQTAATRRFAGAQIGNFQQRLETLHDAGGTRFVNGLTVAIDRPCVDRDWPRPGRGCAQSMPGDEQAAVTPPVTAPAQPATVGSLALWTSGAMSFGDYDPRRGGGDGFEFETSGVSLGADYRTGPAFAFGAGLGYGRDDTDIGDNGSHSEADSLSAAMYASYHPGDHGYVDGLLGYQWLSFQTRRHVTDNGNMVAGERDGRQWFASVAAGYEFQRERIGISPYARLDVARARLDGYVEQGDATHALAYGEQEVDTSTSSLGLRVDYRHALDWGTLSPQLRLEYQHDFHDDSRATMGYDQLLTGPIYRTSIAGFDRNRFMLGLGTVLHTQRDFTLRVEYRTRVDGGAESEQSIMLSLEKSY